MIAKAIKNKENICFVWLYLEIDICKFQLTLLDCITFHEILTKVTGISYHLLAAKKDWFLGMTALFAEMFAK